MLELMLCSLLTILPDYLYRRYRAGQAPRPRDHALFRLVRAAVWHRRLPDAHGLADHDDLLFSSLDHVGDVVLRTVPIMPEVTGRVAEVHVDVSAPVKKATCSSGSTARSRKPRC